MLLESVFLSDFYICQLKYFPTVAFYYILIPVSRSLNFSCSVHYTGFRTNKKPYSQDCWKTFENVIEMFELQLQTEKTS